MNIHILLNQIFTKNKLMFCVLLKTIIFIGSIVLLLLINHETKVIKNESRFYNINLNKTNYIKVKIQQKKNNIDPLKGFKLYTILKIIRNDLIKLQKQNINKILINKKNYFLINLLKIKNLKTVELENLNLEQKNELNALVPFLQQDDDLQNTMIDFHDAVKKALFQKKIKPETKTDENEKKWILGGIISGFVFLIFLSGFGYYWKKRKNDH